MSAIEDDALLVLLNDPDTVQSGFRVLVQTYSQQMYWQIRKLVISHEDADDVLQLVFIKVFKGIKNFKGESKLSTWLYRICYNESMTFLGKKAKRFQISDGELLNRLTENLESDVYFEGSEIELQLQKALVQLPDRQREIFNMRYYDDLMFKDIAVILELSEGAVKSSYHLAAKKIKSYLVED
ncbi:MAG: sigma-70 family RNA polymerase sigma factor [Nonlabens sp.]